MGVLVGSSLGTCHLAGPVRTAAGFDARVPQCCCCGQRKSRKKACAHARLSLHVQSIERVMKLWWAHHLLCACTIYEASLKLCVRLSLHFMSWDRTR